MPKIMENIDEFTRCLLKNIPIVGEKNGKFRYLSTCELIPYSLSPHQEIKRLIQLGKTFCDVLDLEEQIPVRFSDREVGKQRSSVQKCLNAAEIVLNYLDDYASKNRYEIIDLYEVMDQISRRIIGLFYRVEKRHGGLDQEAPREDLIQQLTEKAANWKKKQKLYPKKDKALNERDHEKIKEACQYPSFVELILSNTALCDTFFKWSIRDNNLVSPFVEFPGTADRLREVFLDKRVGRFNPNELTIFKKKIKGQPNSFEKIIRLPFYDGTKVKRISILDENREVLLNNQRRMMIKDIFAIFLHKKIEPGDIDYFGVTGITNWGVCELGPFNSKTENYDLINIEEKYWWQQLPTFEIFSKEALEKKYHITIPPGFWVQTVKSTRESLDYQLMHRHGYIEMAIPLKDDQYAIYPFGTLPENFPTHWFEQLKTITATIPGKLSYPEENESYSHRQHAAMSFVITEEVGLRKMDEIKKYIIKSFAGNLIFQLGGENCAYFAEQIAHVADEKNVDIFKMSLVEMQPTHSIISFLLKCPVYLQKYILEFLQYAAEKSGLEVIENKAVIYKTTLFREKYYQYQPGRLNQLIEDGKREGVLRYGN